MDIQCKSTLLSDGLFLPLRTAISLYSIHHLYAVLVLCVTMSRCVVICHQHYPITSNLDPLPANQLKLECQCPVFARSAIQYLLTGFILSKTSCSDGYTFMAMCLTCLRHLHHHYFTSIKLFLHP